MYRFAERKQKNDIADQQYPFSSFISEYPGQYEYNTDEPQIEQ